jgi:hypothetical protein
VNAPRKLASFLFAAACCSALAGCGFFKGDAFRYDPGIPPQVIGVRAAAGDKVVTLSWTPNYVATSYNVYYLSQIAGAGVSTGTGRKLNTTSSSVVIGGLDNNVTYHFIVAGQNRDGEGVASEQVSATPSPIDIASLMGDWWFHTLVTGPDARWERGLVTIDGVGNAAVSQFEVSNAQGGSDTPDPPPAFKFQVKETGELTQYGPGAWGGFRGIVGSRKNMMVATYSPSSTSRALTIFQKRKASSDPDYGIEDISGTGSGQNPYDTVLQGNGPTRFAYHALSSGSSTQWEYSNCKIGMHGQYWYDDQGNKLPRDAVPYKDVIYWDYSTPTYKTAPKYDYLWKVTAFGIDLTGLVKEYQNNPPHDVVFTGRMTADKTVIVGVSTRRDPSGAYDQYFLRIMQLTFRPADQALPHPTLTDLVGDYKFHEISSSGWAYGVMSVDDSGKTTFTKYADSQGRLSLPDTFTLSYYPDNGLKTNPDGSPLYTDFANYATPAQDGRSHYYDPSGAPYNQYYDYWSYGRASDPLEIPISPYYYNEHASLSYNRDLIVLTRTDASGNSLLVGLK